METFALLLGSLDFFVEAADTVSPTRPRSPLSLPPLFSLSTFVHAVTFYRDTRRLHAPRLLPPRLCDVLRLSAAFSPRDKTAIFFLFFLFLFSPPSERASFVQLFPSLILPYREIGSRPQASFMDGSFLWNVFASRSFSPFSCSRRFHRS